MSNKLNMVKAGDIFGRLTVLRYLEPKRYSSGKIDHRVLCICTCGSQKEVNHGSLTGGGTRSCGCLSTETKVKHGGIIGGEDRLYHCWLAMRRRAKARGSSCNIYSGWGDYSNFKNWSLLNGYTDNLVLCRNGDIGDYSPTNARWDTTASNVREKFCKDYKLTKPDGSVEIITGLREISRRYQLHSGCLSGIIHGRYKQHKGYKVEIYEKS